MICSLTLKMRLGMKLKSSGKHRLGLKDLQSDIAEKIIKKVGLNNIHISSISEEKVLESQDEQLKLRRRRLQKDHQISQTRSGQ